MLEKILEKRSLWEYLSAVKKPIYIYGMGDGALKIISVMQKLNIPLAGIYASDEFVRGHSFCGFRVMRLDEVKSQNDEFISLLAFAAQREVLLEKIYSMADSLELYAPDVPVVKTDDEIFDIDYIIKHETEFDFIYSKLADDLSKRTLLNVLNFKISGKISYLREITSPIFEVYTNIIKPFSTDNYVDLGAYNGDTVLEFLQYSNGANSITAFEPDKKNYARLLKTLHENGILADCFNLGAWENEATLYFQGGKGGRNSKLNSCGEIAVNVNSVDNILAGKPASVIKLDVEGAEMQAINGCAKTIMQYKPRIMLSAYHKNEDLFALPIRLLELNPDYKLFLRHHEYIPAWETNFYLI